MFVKVILCFIYHSVFQWPPYIYRVESHRNERCDTRNCHVDKRYEGVASRSHKRHWLVACVERKVFVVNERKGHSSELRTASFRGWCRARRRELFSFVFSTVTSLLLRVLYVCVRVFPSVRDDLVRTKRREDALLSLRSLSLFSLLLFARCVSRHGLEESSSDKDYRNVFLHVLYLEFCLKFCPPRASLSSSWTPVIRSTRVRLGTKWPGHRGEHVSRLVFHWFNICDFARARTRNTINPLTERCDMGEYLRRNKETIKWFRLVPLGQGYASNFWQSPEGQRISRITADGTRIFD